MKKFLATAQLVIVSSVILIQSIGMSTFAQNAKSSFSNNSTNTQGGSISTTDGVTTNSKNGQTNQGFGDSNGVQAQTLAPDGKTGPGSDGFNQAKGGGISTSTSVTTNNEPSSSTPSDKLGIGADQKCLVNGQCTFSIYKLLGIRQDTTSEEAVSAPLFAQDVVLGVTFFIGTIVTIALIYSGLLLVFSGYDEKMAQAGKDGIKSAIIGLIIVTFSYTIIRLVQYIVKG